MIGIHSGVAVMLQNGGWQIDEEEAQKLAVAITKVQAQYNMVLDPKSAAWIGLIGAAGSVYGPRLAGQWMMHKMKRAMAAEGGEQPREEKGAEEQPQPQPTNVTPIQRQADGDGKIVERKINVGEMMGAVVPSQIYPPGYRGG